MAAFELQGLASELQLLHEIGGAREQHAVAVLDQRVSEGRATVRLAAAGRPEQQQVGAAFSSQVSPAASAIRRALLSIGTAAKSKLSRVLPGGRWASTRCRSMRRRPRSAISSSASAASSRTAGQPSWSERSVSCGHIRPIAGRRSSVSSSGSRVCFDLDRGHARQPCQGGSGPAHSGMPAGRRRRPGTARRPSPAGRGWRAPARSAHARAARSGRVASLPAYSVRAIASSASQARSCVRASSPTMIRQASRGGLAPINASQACRNARRGNSWSR